MKDGRGFCSVIILQPRSEDGKQRSFKCLTKSTHPSLLGIYFWGWGVGCSAVAFSVCSPCVLGIGMWARLDSAGLLLSNMRMPGVFRVRGVCTCRALRGCTHLTQT